MTDPTPRLLDCFANAFPDVPSEALTTLDAETFEPWDSLATVTLAALIEEEFDIEIDAEAAEHFKSFQAIAAFLASSAS